MRNSIIAVLLCVSMLFTTGCNTSWIDTALKDLPVLLQIATNILGIISVAQGQGQIDPAQAAQIQSLGTEVKADLQLVQTLVNQYQSAADADKGAILAKIDDALSAANGNLGAILNAAHIKNPELQAAISAAVGLALTTVLAIQSLVPQPAAAKKVRTPQAPPSPKDLKRAFNAIVSPSYSFAVIK